VPTNENPEEGNEDNYDGEDDDEDDYEAPSYNYNFLFKYCIDRNNTDVIATYDNLQYAQCAEKCDISEECQAFENHYAYPGTEDEAVSCWLVHANSDVDFVPLPHQYQCDPHQSFLVTSYKKGDVIDSDEDDDDDNDKDFESFVESLPLQTIAIILLTLFIMFLIHTAGSASYLAAIMESLRTNSKARCKHFYMCFACPYWGKLLCLTVVTGVIVNIGVKLFILPRLVGQLLFTFVVPLHKEHAFLGVVGSIRASTKVVLREPGTILRFTLLIIMLNFLGFICIVGLLVTVPLSAVAFCFLYHHLVGIREAAIMIPRSQIPGPADEQQPQQQEVQQPQPQAEVVERYQPNVAQYPMAQVIPSANLQPGASYA
jgi:hypothetical protein